MEHTKLSSWRGQQGEILARAFLERKGMRFVGSNWRCKVGEIDLIMQDGTARIFVEVRLRRPTLFGEGSETVAYQKQQKLIRTAKLYQQLEHWWGDVRFDVISIVQEDDHKPHIEHITHAFMA